MTEERIKELLRYLPGGAQAEEVLRVAIKEVRAEASGAPQDAVRYRWLNNQHNFMIYIENEHALRTNMRLRCGEPLDKWIDARIEEENKTA